MMTSLIKTLHKRAKLASLAYEDDTLAIEHHLFPLGYKLIAILDRSNAFGFIAEKDGIAYVVFRGTDDYHDWIANVSILPAKIGKFKAPKGFVEEVDKLWARIVSEIEQHKFPAVHFIGHSLGGAMAVIAAIKAIQHGWEHVDGVTTFGQPRCCCKAAGELLKDVPVHRVVNCDDKVTNVPTPLFKPYRHIRAPIYINRKKELVENASGSYMFWDGLRTFSLAKPHYRQTYVDVLS